MANSVDPDQTAPIGAVCSGSTLFASMLNLSVMLGNYLQQTTSVDDIFRCIFFGALRVTVKSETKSVPLLFKGLFKLRVNTSADPLISNGFFHQDGCNKI